MGVVYHANYLVWMEMARTELIRAHGITYAEMEQQGYALVVAEASVRYLAAARYDDEVIVTATLRDVRSRSLRIDYDVTRAADERQLATGFTALVSVDLRTERPVAMPASIRVLFDEHQDA